MQKWNHASSHPLAQVVVRRARRWHLNSRTNSLAEALAKQNFIFATKFCSFYVLGFTENIWDFMVYGPKMLGFHVLGFAAKIVNSEMMV